MKTDFYTKTVLTVIAVCLVVIVCRGLDIIPSVKANEKESVTMQSDLKPNYDGSINVRVVQIDAPSNGVPVEIKNVSSYSGIPVQIKSADRTIPVEVKNYRDFK